MVCSGKAFHCCFGSSVNDQPGRSNADQMISNSGNELRVLPSGAGTGGRTVPKGLGFRTTSSTSIPRESPVPFFENQLLRNHMDVFRDVAGKVGTREWLLKGRPFLTAPVTIQLEN